MWEMNAGCVQHLSCLLQASSCLNVAGRLLLFASVWVASAMPAVPKGQPVVTCTLAQNRAQSWR